MCSKVQTELQVPIRPLTHPKHSSIHRSSNAKDRHRNCSPTLLRSSPAFVPRICPEGMLPQDYVTPHAGEPVLRKYDQSSAFGAQLVSDRTTSLKDVLEAQGIKTVILVGQSSPHCVSSTARSAFDLGLSVVVAGDACATYATAGIPEFPGVAKGDIKEGKACSAELVHGVAMAHLDGDIADVVGTPEVLKFL